MRYIDWIYFTLGHVYSVMSHFSNNKIYVSFIYYLDDLKCSKNSYAVTTFTIYETLFMDTFNLIITIVNSNWQVRNNVVTVTINWKINPDDSYYMASHQINTYMRHWFFLFCFSFPSVYYLTGSQGVQCTIQTF